MHSTLTLRLPELSMMLDEDRVLVLLRRQVALRLSGVCAGYPQEELEQLVDRIARFKRRWQLLESPELVMEEAAQRSGYTPTAT